MKTEQRRCCNCEEHFPATTDHFYTKRRTKTGAAVLDYVCRPCRVAINRDAEVKRKADQAVNEMAGPPKPTQRPAGRPLTVKKQKPQPQPALCPVPRGVAMLSAWRGPVPAGYGVGA